MKLKQRFKGAIRRVSCLATVFCLAVGSLVADPPTTSNKPVTIDANGNVLPVLVNNLPPNLPVGTRLNGVTLTPNISAIGGLTGAANKVPYFTSSSAAALADLSAFGRSVIDDADAAAGRATLGAVGLTGSETVAGVKTFSSAPILSAATASTLGYIDASKNVVSLGTPTVRGIVKTVYGAVRTDGLTGSGTAEDPLDLSTATLFDAKINSMRTTGGNWRLILGPGTFPTKGSQDTTSGAVTAEKWPDNILITGQGKYATTIQLSTQPTAGYTKWWVISSMATGSGNIQVRNLTIDCNWDGISHSDGTDKVIGGINLVGANNSIDDVRFIGYYGYFPGRECFVARFFGTTSNYSNVSATNLLFESPGTGSTYQTAIAFHGDGVSNLLSNCRGNNNTALGVFHTGLYNLAYVDGVTIGQEDFFDGGAVAYSRVSGYGVFHDTGSAKNVTIRGARFLRCQGGGVFSTAVSGSASGWTISGWVVENNTIELIQGQVVPPQIFCVMFHSATAPAGGSISDVVVRNNQFSKNTGGAGGDAGMNVRYLNNTSNVLFQNNKLGNLASAGTNGTEAGTRYVLNRTSAGGTISGLTDTTLVATDFGSTATGVSVFTAASASAGRDAFGATSGVFPVAAGGSGVGTFTAYAPIFGGTTSTGALQSGTVGTSGQVLTSNGAGALATFQTPAVSSVATDTIWAALGDLVYGTGNDTSAVLSGTTAATTQFLSQTGNGSISAAPIWKTPTQTRSILGLDTGDSPTFTAITVPAINPASGLLITMAGGGNMQLTGGTGVFTAPTITATTGMGVTGTMTVDTGSLILSGNQSAAAWTTSGLRLKGVSGTLTDTTSSGTVPAAYTNKLGGNTIAASSSTTFTNYISNYFSDPVAGTNVTLTNKYAVGGDSAIFGTSNALTISTSGVLTATSPVFTTPNIGAATGTSFVSTGASSNSYTGTASTPAMKYSGVPFAGTGTTSFPLVYINDANATASTVLNTAGTYFGINGDGTQDLMNLLKDGVSQFKVSSTGIVTLPAGGVFSVANTASLGSGSLTLPASGYVQISSRSYIDSLADGNWTLHNSAGTGFSLLQFGGTTAVNSHPAIGRDAVNGFTLQSAAGTATWNDASTAGSGTVANRYLFGIAAPTLTSTNAITDTVASTIYIGGAPTASGSTTIGTAYSLFVDAGNVRFDGDLTVGGSIDWNGDTYLYRDGAAATLQLGVDAATPAAQTFKGPDGVGTDKTGGSVNFAGGKSTGTGAGGSISFQTSNSSTTGSSPNTFSTRAYHSAKPVDLTEATATTIGNIALAAGKGIYAHLDVAVFANDGTDYQMTNKALHVYAVNKAGTLTVTTSAGGDFEAASTGSLSVTLTAVANGNSIDIKADATSSLTQTSLKAKWSITQLNSDDTATVTPQ